MNGHQAPLFDADTGYRPRSVADGPLVVFDTETSGVDYDTSRIITYAVGLLQPDGQRDIEHGIINPRVPIPEGATAVHGWDQARLDGTPEAMRPTVGIRRIMARLQPAIDDGVPVVAFNARFDMTLLARECVRVGVDPSPLDGVHVIDPLILDKGTDKWRKGSRRLQPVCEHHGIDLGDAWHDAQADAVAAGVLARKLIRDMQKDNPLDVTDAGRLHRLQVRWADQQATSLADYFRRKGKPDYVEPVWPIAPRKPQDHVSG